MAWGELGSEGRCRLRELFFCNLSLMLVLSLVWQSDLNCTFCLVWEATGQSMQFTLPFRSEPFCRLRVSGCHMAKIIRSGALPADGPPHQQLTGSWESKRKNKTKKEEPNLRSTTGTGILVMSYQELV